MKKLITSLSIASALLVSLMLNTTSLHQDPPNDGGVFICEDTGEDGPIFYPADYSTEITNEPSYNTQNSYTFSCMNYNNAHKYYRGDSVKVAVIDSGLNYTHEDFRDSSNNYIIQGNSRTIDNTSGSWLYYQFSSGYQSKIVDSLGHGTNVASVIASQINALGCAGIAPNVELYVYKVTNTSNGYEWTAINSALSYCIDEGMDVVNMSFQAYEHSVTYNGSTMGASTGCSSVMTSYINSCYNAGITLVAAAGNYNTSEPSYPASNNHVISVGSLAESSTTSKAGYSNTYGIDLVAPGTVYVADKGTNSSYKKTSGTSFSAPIVTAAIALYKQQNPSATPSQIETALYNSCDPISGNPSWAGNGRLNIDRFLGLTDYPTDIALNNPEIDNGTLELEVGDTLDLNWTVNGEGTFDDSVSFSTYSGGSSVVSVNSNGKITAIAEGSDTVYITSTVDSSVYASIEVTVTAASAPAPTVSSVTISPSSLDLDLSGITSGNLTATVNGDNNPSQIVSWNSSDTSVATVSGLGVVTAKATGTATITATSEQDGTKSGSCKVTVIDSSALPTSEDINDYNVGSTALTSSDITNGAKVVLGKSSTSLGYSVDSNWVYLDSAKDQTLVFTIEGNSSGFTLKNGDNYLYCSAEKKVQFSTSYKTTFKLQASTNYLGNDTVGYFCFNSTGLRPYKSGSYSDHGFLYPLTLKATLSSISVKTAPTKTTYEAGEYFNPTGLVITKTFSDNSKQDLSYSGNESSFTFNPTTSTALLTSNTSVTITVDGKTCSQPITVTAAKTLSSISIDGYKVAFVEGDSFSYGGTVTAHFSDATTSDVTGSATFSGFNLNNIGNQTVTVSYTHKGTTKTDTYGITVSAGTLSSIGVSGMTTQYQKNYSFSFDGTCTATFANGYQKSVTPTSVSSPDMSTAGNKTITVSFTYNGNTRTTTYDISVLSNRVVVEYIEQSGYVEIGEITYPSNTETITPNSGLSVPGKTRCTVENNTIRIGSKDYAGSLTITSSTTNITKIEVSAKYYSTDTGTTLSIAGSSYSLTSSETTYTKEFTTAVSSVLLSTSAAKKRAVIDTITVYKTSTTQVENDISNSEDCQGLETFIDTYMHMNYVENLGYCNDSEHHYYSTAKIEFNKLNAHQRTLFTSNSAYSVEWARLSTWASKNGDSLNSSNLLASRGDLNILSIKNTNKIGIIVIISLVGLSSVGAYLMLRRRKED